MYLKSDPTICWHNNLHLGANALEKNLSACVIVLDKNTISLTLIALSGFMYLSSDLIMTVMWYLQDLQPYTVVFWVKTATNILNFAQR